MKTCASLPGVEMTQFQARVWSWLQARSHLPQGVCHAADTLAKMFGVSRRYVQLALRFFVRLGVLRRVVDYGLRTRRRFFVVGSPGAMPLFPPSPGGESEPAPPIFLGALECAQSAHSSALTSDPPLEPPIEVSGETTDGGGGPGSEPPPPDVLAVGPTEEQLNNLVEQARQALPGHPSPAPWIKSLVGRFTAPWVQAALRRAQERRACGSTIKTGYVIATLNGFAEEGAPPPELTAPPPKARMSDEEWARRMTEKMAGLRGR